MIYVKILSKRSNCLPKSVVMSPRNEKKITILPAVQCCTRPRALRAENLVRQPPKTTDGGTGTRTRTVEGKNGGGKHGPATAAAARGQKIDDRPASARVAGGNRRPNATHRGSFRPEFHAHISTHVLFVRLSSSVGTPESFTTPLF